MNEITYKVIVNKKGTFWYNEKDEYHRENGPAVEYTNENPTDRLHHKDVVIFGN